MYFFLSNVAFNNLDLTNAFDVLMCNLSVHLFNETVLNAAANAPQKLRRSCFKLCLVLGQIREAATQNFFF